MRLAQFTNDGWRFDLTDGGDGNGRTVILLHGFPADRGCWDEITGGLQAAGYRTLAPDQRGYSPGAQPRARRAYRVAALAGDVLALADAAQVDRFDLVGHDWGAALAWDLAARHPDRVRSLAALSVPHPGAFAQALRHRDQLLHSWYMAAIQIPLIPERALGARQGAPLRTALQRSGLDPTSAARYAQRAASGAMRGPLSWYRALPFDLRQIPPPVEIPSLFAWGDADRFITEQAAARAGSWMHGPGRCQTLPGVSHWIPETAAGVAASLLLEHLASVAA